MAQRTCSVDGCEKPTDVGCTAKGMCSVHYRRVQRHGDPLKLKRIVGDNEARFWSKVNKDGPLPTWAPFLGPCWLWTASCAGGYGRMWLVDRLIYAHRFSYQVAGRSIPPGWDLDHLCRVRACVNPDHLEPVTRTENMVRAALAGALR